MYYLCASMSKNFHPYIAILLLFLFGFSLTESGLHALIHADHHDHEHLVQMDDAGMHVDDCDHHHADLSLEAAEEICKLCTAFTLNAAFDLWAPSNSTPSYLLSSSRFFSELPCENSELTHFLTRGPPVA